MKFGVLADIHGNFEAFKTCIDYLEGINVDGYILLGDYVGEYPHPEKTFELIHKLMATRKCYVLKGNKEDYILSGLGSEHPEWDEFPSVVGMLRYGYSHLAPKEKDFIKTLPDTLVIDEPGTPSLRICHGAPDNVKGFFMTETEENIKKVQENFILCAHTHKPGCVERFGKKIINPGSVGLPVQGEMAAQCMVLYGDEAAWHPDFIELSYNVDKVAEEMRSEGLFEKAPFWSIVTLDILRGGKVSHGKVLKYAMNLCEKERGECLWPLVPECYMSKAVSDLVFLE